MDSQLSIILRPANFADVIGHDSAVAVLKAEIDAGTVPRAIMFVGTPGTGKTTLARIVARAVQGWDFPLDQDPDVLEINAAAVRGIDPMKELVEETQTYPMVGKYRVVILDEAQQITKEGQNVLLKPLEESNSATVWIICTTNPEKLIEAIRSRCRIFQLTSMSAKNIHDLLARAAKHVGCADFAAFEAEAVLRKLSSPRPLLNAFENFYKGMNAQDAVNNQAQSYAPQHFAIAQAVVFGNWEKDGMIWGKPCKSVKTLLGVLEESFKKKKAAADATDNDEEATDTVEEEGASSKPEVAQGLRAITAALLKNLIVSQKNFSVATATKAADALYILSHCASESAADMAMLYPAVIAGLFRVNLKMTGQPVQVQPHK